MKLIAGAPDHAGAQPVGVRGLVDDGPPVGKVDTVIGHGDTHAIIAAAGARAMKIEEVVRASVVVQPGIPQASHDLRFENHVLSSQCKLRWPVRNRRL